MYIMDALSVLDNAESEGFQNFILNIFDMALLDSTMPLPHALPQLKPNIFIKVYAYVAS